MGEKTVAAVPAEEDLDDTAICSIHTWYRSSTAAVASGGGVCALCLQEKLGKLVSASSKSFTPFLPLHPPPHPPSSSSSSSSSPPPVPTSHSSSSSRSMLPFFRSKKKNVPAMQRSKSVAPRPFAGAAAASGIPAENQRRKGFWSFLSFSSSSSSSSTAAPTASASVARASAGRRSVSDLGNLALRKQMQPNKQVNGGGGDTEDADGSVDAVSTEQMQSERKVARSRSVGCGSRSFSADFLERISNGLGECALRRVESHREGPHGGRRGAKNGVAVQMDDDGEEDGDDLAPHRRFRCAGFFGSGLGMPAAAPSYWLAARGSDVGRARSWTKSWAFTSPMRALKPTTTTTTMTATLPAVEMEKLKL